MTVTLIGNSLTAGNLGIPYARFLNFPENTHMVNRGRDGDTVRGIRARMDEVLRSDGPKVVVVQTGANDILLPEMAARGGAWTAFVDKMVERGSVPTPNPSEFGAAYREILDIAFSWGVEHVIAVTIPPLGEDLASQRNQARRNLNDQIRGMADAGGARLADVAAAFESELAGIEVPSEWFFGKPADFISDVRRVRREKGAAAMSEERGLYLTMDGAHLNERGAALMGRIVSDAVLGR
ncbi:MAG: GDSL-type esterase/lipase family protein [Spirochaetaceae bacterium]|nr:GDSL-type esterase/lipase family protein [Spirochaetaceae bacterium]